MRDGFGRDFRSRRTACFTTRKSFLSSAPKSKCSLRHTAGSCCYYFPAEKLLFSGDTLFEGSFGRVDLPGGNMASLKRSRDRLFELPADTLVLPGHMGQTSIGEERKSNPIFYY